MRKRRVKRQPIPRREKLVPIDSSQSLLEPNRDLVYKDLRKTVFVTSIIVVILVVITLLPELS